MAAHSTPSWLVGNSPTKNVSVKARNVMIGIDWAMSSMGIMTRAAPAALGGQRRDAERKDQREQNRREHPQGRSQSVFGQTGRVEHHRGGMQRRQRQVHLLRAVNDKRGDGADQRQGDKVKPVWRELPARKTRQQSGVHPVGREEDHGLAS